MSPIPSCLRRWLLGAGTAAALVALAPHALAQTVPAAEPARQLHAFFERAFEAQSRRSPEWATYRGDHSQGDRLTDMSPEAQAERDAETRALLAEAEAFPRGGLAQQDLLSLEMFIGAQRRQVEQQAFAGWRTMSLRALGGPHTQFADLMAVSPVSRAELVEKTLARMAAYPRRIDQEIANLRRGMAAGWVPPRDVLQRVLRQIDGQLTDSTEANPHYAPFRRLSPQIPAAERARLQAAARTAIEQHVVPAQRRLRAFVEGEYLPRAAPSGALSGYPGGTAVYAMLVRHNTTLELTPQQIHDIGLRELARLRGQMQAVMTETKFNGDWPAFVNFLNTDPRFFHASPEALLAGYREIAKRLDAEMPKLFAELPRAPYGVSPMPAHMGARAEYYNGPALDGSRGGTFFADIISYRRKPIWAMETLVAHEAVPGHHLQIARSTELAGLPRFRRSGFGYTAFSEGWALYAETLGFDAGLYTDPYSRYGHLQWQAFRAARLVVDTGIHALGWSRQQAIDFMVEQTGVERSFVESEVDRYTSQPGQALAYMIGKLKFDELRDRAKARLGPRFDIRRFHNAVLDHGALPLPLLERMTDAWIAAEAARAG
jgi:uncharacterized protein (DUF885 family)